MKLTLIALSLAMNAVLVVVIAAAPRGSLPNPSAPLGRAVSHHPTPESAPLDVASVCVAELGTPFHWSMIESTNYEVYRDNLRRIGCPEYTLADILTGDVNSHYLDRVDVIADSVGQEFWGLMTDAENLWERIQARAERLQELGQERDAVLDQLLGDARCARCNMSQDQENVLRRKALLDFLPADKVEQCLAIDAKYDRLQAELNHPDLLPADAQAQSKALLRQHEKEIFDHLSESEAAELRLRQSPNVAICSQLLDFVATQDELRGIVAILDQTGPRQGQNNQGQVPSEAAQPLKTLLGPDRYALFERARDPRYHEANALAEKLQLPGNSAATLYGMQADFENLASEIRQQPIDEDDRRDLLGALKSEAIQKLGEFMGSEVREKSATSGYSPGWVTRISQLKP